MASAKEVYDILKEQHQQEVLAEKLCGDILNYAHLNGFTEVVDRIKNDEKKHQTIVVELIELLGYEV